MRTIKKEDLENTNYYQVPKWLMDLFIDGKISQGGFKTYVLMYDRLRLSSKKGWIDKNDEVYIRYSYDEMQSDLNCSRQTVSNNLKDLEKLELIDKKRGFNSSTVFYLNTYSISLENFTSKEDFTSKESLDACESRNLDYSSLESLDSSKNNFSKNNLIITTTIQDNINYKDQDTNQPEKASSSSFEKNINEIKGYLLENVKDIATCKNIMFLVENIGLSLERIKEVVNYATKSQKGIGFIYKALEENWTLKDITYSTEKNISTTPTARGHKFNSEAIDSTIEAKEAKEEYTAKIDRLQGIYQVLSDTEKKKVDDEAYQLAVKQYGPTVAKIMARTKTKFEILEKYYLLEKGA